MITQDYVKPFDIDQSDSYSKENKNQCYYLIGLILVLYFIFRK